MEFKIRPILSEMKALYQMPISEKRFQAYINKLKGQTKADLVLPIGGYNPMAKIHVLEKIIELENLGTEDIIEKSIQEINAKIQNIEGGTFMVVLNLADDLKGAWTDRYTTDYESKFKINPLVNRNFCTPYFWTSEEFNEEIIVERTSNYLYRTIYWIENPKPITLEDHFLLESFLAKHSNLESSQVGTEDIRYLNEFYNTHKLNDDYSLIFNFFYGDKASESLGYPSYGIGELNGFDLARQ